MSQQHGSQNRRSSRTLTQTQTTQPDPLICPRCQSTNTKFCYYNNYNKTQPRYFCKACKRHWTSGGILRNVPVGGGRKNKRLQTATNQETYDHEPKAEFLTQASGDKKDEESYIDIDELKGLVSWDVYGISEFFHDHQDYDYYPFSRLLSSFDTNPSSNIQISALMSWKDDLESMVLEDMNKPWEDPTFKA